MAQFLPYTSIDWLNVSSVYQGTTSLNALYVGNTKLWPRTLASISVTHQPDTTTFPINSTLDLTGIVVTADYGGGTIDVTNLCTYNPPSGTTLSTIGQQAVEITYTEGGVDTEEYTDMGDIIGFYNSLDKIKLGEETNQACEDNTTIYNFTRID